ncbi:hypothetical protein QYE76_071726 [Lolium multiflorum]|uniref:Retrotransposon gag domain-containing protein n=1 Tax=Lolium multiflorum TaxID=4521 RepID=A0AAD8SM48_LOLMU|nr:hypothetical protein QYE76_071726 [Lolium multiflorum]
MLDERKEATHFVETFHSESLRSTNNSKVKELQRTPERQGQRASAGGQQNRGSYTSPQDYHSRPPPSNNHSTPKDNMKKAAEILKKKDEEIDIDYVRTLVASAMKQQSKAILRAGPARIWLSDLEKNSIFCWFDLKNAFEKHFRGTYKRPAMTSDLQACILIILPPMTTQAEI